MRITRFNLHLVFAGCLLLAFKVWEEDSITNKVFARAAGIGVKHIHSIELDILYLLGPFKLLPTTQLDYIQLFAIAYGDFAPNPALSAAASAEERIYNDAYAR